jgi:hypothetical protein
MCVKKDEEEEIPEWEGESNTYTRLSYAKVFISVAHFSSESSTLNRLLSAPWKT